MTPCKIKVLVEVDFENIDMDGGSGGKSKYPWNTTNVGQGFAVPLSALKHTDYRPTVPLRLAKDGVRFISRKTAVDGVPSIVLKRIA